MTWSYLLAYMWQLPHWLIILLLSVSVLLCSIGIVTLVYSQGKGRMRIAGAACFFFGLTWLYAVATPPFHAPDEPTHFLGMLNSLGRISDAAEVRDWANKGHFSEIQFRPHEKFRADWVGYYSQENLEEFFSPIEMETRAPLTAWVWRELKPILGECSIQCCLLSMRLLNGLVVAGFYMLALVVVWKCVPRDEACEESTISPSAFGSAVLLYVPTLPFFSMHVSNYPMLISAGILAAFIALAVLFLERRPLWMGGMLGFSVFLLMFSGRGGYPFSAFVLLVTIIGAVLPRSQDGNLTICRGEERVSAALFWSVFALGWIISWLLLGRLDLTPVLSLVSHSIPKTWNPFSGNKWILIAVPVLCFAVEYLFSFLRHLQLSSRKVRFIAIPGVFLFSVGIFGPIWGTSHYLENIEGIPLVEPTSTYIMHVLLAYWGSMGLGSPDYFLIRYFWTGFGWLDTLFSGSVVMLLGLPVFCGNLLLWLRAYRTASLPLVSRLWVWLITCALYLSVLAFGARNTPVNLHGRYLILFNVLFLPPGFAGFFSFLTHRASLSWMRTCRFAETVPIWLTPPRAVWNGMIAVCISIHCYSIWFLLNRYF